MIDTHAHLYSEQFASDRFTMLERAIEQGITRIIMPNVDSTTIEGMLELEHRFSNLCYPAMGLHPCHVKKDFEKELYVVEEWLFKRPFTAVGEIGLDLYWDKTHFEEQQEAFLIQLAWAKQLHLPAIVHTRSCMDETIALLEKAQDGTLTGVVHCFSGNLAQAEKIIGLGFYVGIGGVVTYPKGGLDSVIPHIPLEKIVLETDAPYLAPVPHRGKRNESSYLPLIAERIAELRGVGLTDVVNATDRNTKHLFPKINL